MIRASVVFAVVIVVISEVSARAGNGDDKRCGFRKCRQNQCCVNGLVCMQKLEENDICGNFQCPCPEGLECRGAELFGLVRRCLDPEFPETEPSTSTDSSSTDVSTDSVSTDVSTDSVSTDVSTDIPTTLGK